MRMRRPRLPAATMVRPRVPLFCMQMLAEDEEGEEDEEVDDSISASPEADVKIIFPEHQDLCACRPRLRHAHARQRSPLALSLRLSLASTTRPSTHSLCRTLRARCATSRTTATRSRTFVCDAVSPVLSGAVHGRGARPGDQVLRARHVRVPLQAARELRSARLWLPAECQLHRQQRGAVPPHALQHHRPVRAHPPRRCSRAAALSIPRRRSTRARCSPPSPRSPWQCWVSSSTSRSPAAPWFVSRIACRRPSTWRRWCPRRLPRLSSRAPRPRPAPPATSGSPTPICTRCAVACVAHTSAAPRRPRRAASRRRAH